jgi:hypothetical protein
VLVLSRKTALQATAFITYFNYFAVMRHTIQQGGGHFGVAEDLRPFAEVQIRRNDKRYMLIQFGHSMEQQLTDENRKRFLPCCDFCAKVKRCA